MREARHTMSCTAWSVLSLVLLACALALFLVYLLAQRLSLRKAGFYGTVVAVLLCMLTTWFALGERREMLDDTSAVVMTASTAVKKMCIRDSVSGTSSSWDGAPLSGSADL